MEERIHRQLEVAGTTRERLLDAGTTELAESGHAALTVRLVARRAGVSPATAYKAFASKEHLLAAVFLRHLRGIPAVDEHDERPLVVRLPEFTTGFAQVIVADDELAAALRSVFFSEDADSLRIRDMVLREFEQRFYAVCRTDLTGEALRTTQLAFAGAMIMASARLLPVADIGPRMAEAVRCVHPGP